MSCRRWPRAFALAFVTIGVGACSAMHPDPAREWVSPIGRNHGLTGLTLEVATGRLITEDELVRAVASADIVLLGEQHDNVDHHRLQAALLEKMIAAGRRPAVAFEQINLEDQPALDGVLASGAGDAQTAAERASAVASAVAWDKSGWPPFDEYRPVFEVALSAQLPLRAANLSRKRLHERHARQAVGPPADDAGLVPLTEEMHASMVADIVDSHCGYAEPRMVSMMVNAQRRRDAAMAGAVRDALGAPACRNDADAGVAAASEPVAAVPPAGVVLLCGFAHARTDFGVPLSLRRLAPGRRIVSVAFLGVHESADEPADYADAFHTARLPFDFVTFTPRPDSTDPCEKFRADLQKMKTR